MSTSGKASQIIILLFFLISIINKTYADSPLPIQKKIRVNFVWYTTHSQTLSEKLKDDAINSLTAIIDNNVSDRYQKRSVLHFMKVLMLKKAFRNKNYQKKLYADMARISARLKLYPLAMQIYHHELQEKNEFGNYTDTSETEIEDTEQDSTNTFTTEKNTRESAPVSVADILQSFDDNKEASEYAMMVHVKQPVSGKRKSYTGIDNVGHMFITLIKYNTDNTYVSRSFGFYPQKNSLLSATPFKPTASPVFKDDAMHDWDETIGKFISHRRFLKIIKLLSRYEFKMYNLNENNCTDFGLTVASLSGIEINETKGRWPFGKGNNPANAGQSILENKIDDKDVEDTKAIFVFKK